MQKTIKDLFIDELHDMLSAEEQIVKALPKVIDAVESKELKEAYQSHLQETKGQIKRLEKVFKLLKSAPQKKFCRATKGLIEECNEVIEEYSKSPVRDAAIISKTQRVEHYEISAYGTLCTFAKELGEKEIARLLHETFLEEEHADKKLTKLAEGGFLTSGINHQANIPEKSLASNLTKKAALKTPLKKTTAQKNEAPSKKAPAKQAVAKKVVAKAVGAKDFAVKTFKKGVTKAKHLVASR